MRVSPEDSRETFHSVSPAVTMEIAHQLGDLLRGGEFLGLVGDLGAGKTTFTKGLCRGLGLADTGQVASPSYVLEHIYQGRLRVHHYDAYRLESAGEFVALGFEEHVGSHGAVLVVEWADRVAAALPPERLEIDIAFAGTTAASSGAGEEGTGEGRTLTLAGPAEIWGATLDELAGRVRRRS